MTHVTTQVQLQTPPFATVNGELVPYADVRIHVSAEALTRGLSIFEGLKGYWNPSLTEFGIRTPERHYQRLRRSAHVLHIPIEFSYEEYCDAILCLARALLTTERDMWFRTTVYVVEGHWGEGTRADLVVTAYHQDKTPAQPMPLGVSTWRRADDTQLPFRVKSAANFVVARQARIEARGRGFVDAILLNSAGRVAEASGSCVLAHRDGTIVSPPPYEGALESITLDVLESLTRAEGLALERRPVDLSELHTSDELALTGTITDVTLVSRLETTEYPTSGAFALLRDEYLRVMRRERRLEDVRFLTLGAEELGSAAAR